MTRNRTGLIALVLGVSISLGLAFGADPDCNYQFPTTARYCVDPFVECEAFDGAAEGQPANWLCPATYDDTQSIIPSCTYSNTACAAYCTSSGTTKCSQVRKCKKKPGTNDCIDDGANNAPTNTTKYFGADCVDDCPDE